MSEKSKAKDNLFWCVVRIKMHQGLKYLTDRCYHIGVKLNKEKHPIWYNVRVMFNPVCQWLINCLANTGRSFLEALGLSYYMVMLDIYLVLRLIFLFQDGGNGVPACDQFNGGFTRMQLYYLCKGKHTLPWICVKLYCLIILISKCIVLCFPSHSQKRESGRNWGWMLLPQYALAMHTEK